MKSKEVLFASIAVALGVSTMYAINRICGEFLEPIIGTCTNPDYEPKIEIHPYEPKVGLGIFGPFVCFLSQFLFHVTENYPAGLLTFGGVIIVSHPLCILMIVEAGRGGAKGIIRYPTLVSFLAFVFGVAVFVPAMWLPAYILGRGGWTQPVAPERAWVAVAPGFLNVALTLGAFLLSTDTYAGQLFVSMLCSPILVCAPLLVWNAGPPAEDEHKTALRMGVRATVAAYFVAGCLEFVFWWFLVFVAVKTYGIDIGLLWDALWTNADASILFMTIDVAVLWLTGLLYVAFHSYSHAANAILLTTLLGPGASLSFVLSRMELERLSAGASSDQKEKKA